MLATGSGDLAILRRDIFHIQDVLLFVHIQLSHRDYPSKQTCIRSIAMNLTQSRSNYLCIQMAANCNYSNFAEILNLGMEDAVNDNAKFVGHI